MTKQQENKLEKIRHSLSHLMSMAISEIYPKVGLGMGPPIENGFYQDYGLKETITPEILPKLEKRMREFIKQDIKFEQHQVIFKDALSFYKHDPYKTEIIGDLKAAGEKNLSFYKSGFFDNLCAGPHVKSTKEINPDAFKLTRIAGAYWKGDEKNKMLTRIYGVAFNTKKELDEYLKTIEEAEKRDHRILGKKLDLFHFDEEFGAGLPLWHPKGALLRKFVEEYCIEEYLQNGYHLLSTPHIARLELWKKSGHWNFYRENMYSPMEVEKEKYVVKPMNCPGHILIYNHQPRSYREFPLRFTELGTVYRFEKSGVLHGLTRVRGFTQDDAHIFCTPKQLDQELTSCLKLGVKILKTFGFKEYDIYLSTRPKKYIGSLKNWEKATKALKYALEKNSLKYQVEEGEGVFYGPKIDLKIKDSLNRPWQCTTIQVDFNLPEKFNLAYINQKGEKEQPIMIHRALLGSVERFVGVLLEHFSGALPLWLSPVQVEIINVGSAHKKYADSINKQLTTNDIRSNLSDENLTVSKRIREAEIQKIPYILVVGDKEMKNKSVNVRHYRRGQESEIKIEKLIEKLKKEIEEKII